MAEIKPIRRYKYAGDIMPKLLEAGFDLEAAQAFLNSIKDADVVPRCDAEKQKQEAVELRETVDGMVKDYSKCMKENARQIFKDIEALLARECAFVSASAFETIKKKWT